MDMLKLFEPYTKDGHSLESAKRYLEKTAAGLGMRSEAVTLAIQQIMAEVANGTSFPTDRCPCGCGIDKAGTAITHAMRDRMIALDKKFRTAELEVMGKELGQAVKDAAGKKMTNWRRSPVLRWFGFGS